MADDPTPVLEITEQDFNGWKHHPVSKVFLRFLKDREQALLREIAARISAAQTTIDQFALGKLSGRAEEALDHANTSFDEIVSFYTIPQEDNE